MDCEPLSCAACRGKRYARRCRSLPQVRRAAHLPEVCPFGLELCAEPDVPKASAYVPKRRRRQGCAYADRVSCCKIRCRHEKGKGLVFVNAHCTPQRCRYYEIDATLQEA